MTHAYRTYVATAIAALVLLGLAGASAARSSITFGPPASQELMHVAEIDPTVQIRRVDRLSGAVGANPLMVAFDVMHLTEGDEARAVSAYLCDGDTVSAWLFGRFDGDDVTLVGDGVTVDVTFDAGSAYGVVTLGDDDERLFVVQQATPDAGLFRADATIDGADYVGGWVVLADGRQAGALTLDGTIVESPTLDTGSLEAETTVGSLSACCCGMAAPCSLGCCRLR